MIDRRVLRHYEHMLKAAASAACDELCEMYLAEARGMAHYAMLVQDITGTDYEREMQRQKQIRLTRETRAWVAA